MGQVHDFLEAKGRAEALRSAVFQRSEIEAAAAYMSDEESGIGFLYSGWCQAVLPHRRLPDQQAWQVQSERITLMVEPGHRPDFSGGPPTPIGVPYGSRARLIMLYLQSEALRTGSREIELGASLRAWLARMGIPVGGKSVQDVRDQAERISRCRLSFHVQAGKRTGMVQQSIVDRALFMRDDEAPGQGSLFVETTKLSEAFYEQLKRHPVPLEDAAIRAVNNNSMTLDIYAWLAYRLHVLTVSRTVGWKALKGQFGNGFARIDNFRPRFLANLKLALAVYPDAKVDMDDKGATLHPSRSPVAPKTKSIP